MSKKNLSLLFAEKFQSAREAENSFHWKEYGLVADTAKRAAERLTNDAMIARLKYHGGAND